MTDPLKCMSCGAEGGLRPARTITITKDEYNGRAEIHIPENDNPFYTRQNDAVSRGQHLVQQDVALCNACDKMWRMLRSKKKSVIKKRQSQISLWEARCRSFLNEGRCVPALSCYACVHGASVVYKEGRKPHRNLKLMELLDETTQVVGLWHSDFCRASGLTIEKSEEFLRGVLKFRLCSFHSNHARHAMDNALAKSENRRGVLNGLCIFTGLGCAGLSSILRQLPCISVLKENEALEYLELDEATGSLTADRMSVSEAAGRHACADCRYIIQKGEGGLRGLADVSEKNLVDLHERRLSQMIILALSSDKESLRSSIEMHRKEDGTAADMLFSSVTKKDFGKEQLLLLPWKSVVKCYRDLKTSCTETVVDVRTLESHLAPVMGSANIFLFNVSSRIRCYAFRESMNAVEKVISGTIASSVRDHGTFCTTQEKCRALETVGKRFLSRKQEYWNGCFYLNEEISSVPFALWSDIVFCIVPPKRRKAWELHCSINCTNIANIFPVSNRRDVMPQCTLEEVLNRRGGVSGEDHFLRADALIALRALKIIESMVFSRTSGVAGPLTVTISKAGCLEQSNSWTSALNCLGICVSRHTTDRYRNDLVAAHERAEHGSFQNCPASLGTFSVQIDNWNLKGVHAVKAFGKAAAGINGCLVQGYARRRQLGSETVVGAPALHASRGDSDENGNETNANSVTESDQFQWRDPKVEYPTRDAFAASFHSKEHKGVLDDFAAIAIGLTKKYRSRLLGGDSTGSSSASETRTPQGRKKRKKDGPLNFRKLLLSAFKPHGGVDATDESLEDQHIVYVDVCGSNAAEKLTIRRKLSIIESIIQPGRRGRPRFVICAGDQPTFKILFELWRESQRHESSTLWKWMIPFPGFFHTEKQAMYPVCKELFDGLGLQELATCGGLSNGILSKLLGHSNARNNRSLLFDLCAAEVMHLIDIATHEDADLASKLQRIERDIEKNPDGFPDKSKEESYLLAMTSDIVTEDVWRTGVELLDRLKGKMSEGVNGHISSAQCSFRRCSQQ